MAEEKRAENVVTFRFAHQGDEPVIMEFIRELAAHEGVPELVTVNETLLEEWLFDRERARVLFLEENGVPAGFALFFESFATYPGRGGIYLDDLIVKREYRGKGYGKALLKELAKITLADGGVRIEWCCLDDNPSYDFYLEMGGRPLDACTTFRLQGDALRRFAQD